VRAGKGQNGQGKQRHGARGEDALVSVPPGTQTSGLDGATLELNEPEARAVIASGGSGGHGNKRFATSTRQAPRFAERGLPGESGWIELRLKLMADAGLVGLPNAGKSSLLARMTRAAPKIADYPFTTVEPVLGTLEAEQRQLVLADIPGLIEGAAQGAGLGHEFLAHVERCRLLVHVVDVAPIEGDPAEAYSTVRAELGEYGAGLNRLPELVALSKADLIPPEEAERIAAEWRERLGDGVVDVLAVSSATGVGLDALSDRLVRLMPEATREPEPVGAAAEGPVVEHRTYRPGAEQGFEVEREGDGAFRISGRGIELLFERHDLTNEEALAYLEQRLKEIGVLAALRNAGFEPGDEVRVGEAAFEFHPGPA
jgi:GTP-binding protein